jgi:hypothetical protein
LYRLVENFCLEEFGCRRFRVTPSEISAKKDIRDGKCFLEKMGFGYIDSCEAEKVLQ